MAAVFNWHIFRHPPRVTVRPPDRPRALCAMPRVRCALPTPRPGGPMRSSACSCSPPSLLVFVVDGAFAQVVRTSPTGSRRTPPGARRAPWSARRSGSRTRSRSTRGVTLTIQPGVVVKFNSGAQLARRRRAAGGGHGGQQRSTSRPSRTTTSAATPTPTATPPRRRPPTGTASCSPTHGERHVRPSPTASSATPATANYGALTFQSVQRQRHQLHISKSYYGIDCQGTAAPTLTSTTIEASTLHAGACSTSRRTRRSRASRSRPRTTATTPSACAAAR